MKNILFTFMLFFFAFSLNAQRHNPALVKPITYNKNVDAPLTTKEKSFIDEAYGDEAENLVYNIPSRLKEIKNILRNRVVIVTYENKDLSSIQPLSKVSLINAKLQRDYNFDINSFNPLKYRFNFYSRDNTKYFRVDNKQILIQILPQF
ncbi:hypothetical protein ACFQ1Q_11920 [Winogradskyella litorisediminis]|uniref:Uncharacterized protein n=1 Tax=Winogradskyella litorisediminis TaxID=1156618 RepID=A0ABW3NBD9_9FLAO